MSNGRCRYHGGAATGPKTLKAGGRYSRGLGQLAAQADELVAAHDLLDPAPGLALMDLAVNLRLERGLQDGDGPAFRQQALDLCEQFFAQGAQGGVNRGEALKLLIDLREHLRRGVAADRAMSDAVSIVDRRTKATTRILDLQLRSEQAVSRATVEALLSVISRSIRAHAPAESAAIFADIAQQALVLSRRAGFALRIGEGGQPLDAAAPVPG